MNQILAIGNKNGKNNNNSTIDLKKIILFFSIAIIIFGVFLVINGATGLNKNKTAKNPDSSNVVPTATPTQNPDLNIGEPDVEDEEIPVIELLLSGEKIKILVTDNVELDYIEYRWNDEEIETAIPENENKTRIETSLNIKQGVNTLNVLAVDKAGNFAEKTQTFQGKTKPEVKLLIENDELVINAKCEDGISKIEFTANGKWVKLLFEKYQYTKEEWASVGAILEYSDDGKIISVEYRYKLVEGENVFYAYVYSLEGLVGDDNGYYTYEP